MSRSFPAIRLTLVTLLLLTFCLASTSSTWARQPQEEKSAKAKKEEKSKSAQPVEYVSPDAGVKFVKPSPDWEVISPPSSIFQSLVCIPPSGEQVDRFTQRFVVLVYPGSAIVGGMEFRRQQLNNVTSGKKLVPYTVHQNRFEKAKLAGKDADLFEYEFELPPPDVSMRTLEYGLYYQGNFYVVQATAPISDWENPEIAGMFERTFKSFGFVRLAPNNSR
ncbi:MAG: hypothetical protein K1Y36_07815 [Blastocatellia bacterium]|nr:hypothetical protein [Blastocatellia bacterium]